MDIRIPIENKQFLSAILEIPDGAIGIVIFAHGSGSSRLSPRNQTVASEMKDKKIATLLFDLLTSDEEAIDEITAELRFNIPFLADRLIKATRWVEKHYPQLPIGYFGASTGAAAALVATAKIGSKIRAVVSRRRQAGFGPRISC